MKFGDTFHQRSVPEWSTHNVDYGDLKDLIKRRTTRSKGNGEAQPIPGAHNEARASQKFEQELYIHLKDQHARVDLFVRSKAGEYSRKLAHLQRQITHLERQSFSLGQTKISVRKLEKFSKLEDQTLRAGSDIQSLIQFANANRLALQKLLKKYKKWTGSSGLGQRFRRDILNSASNLNSNFAPLLEQYVDTLASVRQPFDSGVNWHVEPSVDQRRGSEAVKAQAPPPKDVHEIATSSAGHLYAVNLKGSPIELDAALATTPLGHQACRAAYWVHPDNIVQLQILLLQHTRIRNWSRSSTTSKSTTGPKPSPRGSVTGHANDCLNTGGQDFGLIVCDDPNQFVARQKGEPIGEIETSTGSTLQKSATTVRYSSDEDLLLVVSVSRRRPENAKQAFFRTNRLKKKAIGHLFENSSDEDRFTPNSSDGLNQFRSWLVKHPEIQPLVQIQHKRSHFIGIHNVETSGIWATLDTDVNMRRCSKGLISSKDQDVLSIGSRSESDLQLFPLAILEVRIEGPDPSGLIAALEASHLVTQVRGFSLETHAIATLCTPESRPLAFWLPQLEGDIRKLPSSSYGVNGRGQHKSPSQEQANTRGTSISAPSTQNGHSAGGFSPAPGESSATSVPEQLANPPLSTFKRKRKFPKKRRLPTKELKGSSPSEQRYWNEFDDGSEGERDEPYAIFVDPNAIGTFLGVATVSRILSSLSENSRTSWEKIQTWLKPKPEDHTNPAERSPLLEDSTSPTSPTIDDSSDSDIETNATVKRRGYSTLPSRHRHHHHHRSARETMLFRCVLGSFTTAILFVIVAIILIGTGRRKATAEVNVGVVICVAASLVFAVIGVGCTIGRHDSTTWLHRAVVGLAFVLVLLGDSGVLVGLGRS